MKSVEIPLIMQFFQESESTLQKPIVISLIILILIKTFFCYNANKVSFNVQLIYLKWLSFDRTLIYGTYYQSQSMYKKHVKF